MSLIVASLLGSVAAMCGGGVGALLHESIHYVVAKPLTGARFALFDQGGRFRMGVYFRPETRLQSEVIRKAPLVVGLVAGIVVASSYHRLSLLPWTFSVGVVWGLLWTSPEDVFADAAARAGSTEVNT